MKNYIILEREKTKKKMVNYSRKKNDKLEKTNEKKDKNNNNSRIFWRSHPSLFRS